MPTSDLTTLQSYRELLARLVARITRVTDFPAETLLNINLPPVAASEVRGVRVTELGSRFFQESLTRMSDPWGREIFWIGGGTIHWTGGENSDHRAVADGFISITPLTWIDQLPLLETVQDVARGIDERDGYRLSHPSGSGAANQGNPRPRGAAAISQIPRHLFVPRVSDIAL